MLGFAVLSYLRTPSRWLFAALWGALLLAGAGLSDLKRVRFPKGARLFAAAAAFLPLAAWDAMFLHRQDPSLYLAPHAEVSEDLAGRPQRVLTDPGLANSNKTELYRMMNVNGYEAFYPKGVPAWAAEAEGEPAADASRVYVSKWRSDAAVRAGVAALLSANGVQRGSAWPLAVYVDAAGRRLTPDPMLWIERPERWRVWGSAPAGAAALELSIPDYPGWRARLDGAGAALKPWGSFQALPLPASFPHGSPFELWVDFMPTGWAPLAGLTAAAWAFWLALLARRAGAA